MVDRIRLSPAAGSLQTRVVDWTTRFAESTFGARPSDETKFAVLADIHQNASPLELLLFVWVIQSSPGLPKAMREGLVAEIFNRFAALELPKDVPAQEPTPCSK